MEGFSELWKRVVEEGITPARAVERKSPPKTEGRDGEFDRIHGNGKEIKLMETKEKEEI